MLTDPVVLDPDHAVMAYVNVIGEKLSKTCTVRVGLEESEHLTILLEAVLRTGVEGLQTATVTVLVPAGAKLTASYGGGSEGHCDIESEGEAESEVRTQFVEAEGKEGKEGKEGAVGPEGKEGKEGKEGAPGTSGPAVLELGAGDKSMFAAFSHEQAHQTDETGWYIVGACCGVMFFYLVIRRVFGQ